MAATIEQIVTDAQQIIGDFGGDSVQTYSTPRMIRDAGRAFNLLFKKRFWAQYSEWTTVILNETTGLITTNAFPNVLDFEDFSAVHIAGSEQSLPRLPEKLNPNILTGTSPRYWTSLRTTHADFHNKKIKIWPIAAEGSLDVYARFHPKTSGQEWAINDSLELNRDLLAYGTAFMALAGDDLNPDARDTCQSMMETLYKSIVGSLANHEISLGSTRRVRDDGWQTV